MTPVRVLAFYTRYPHWGAHGGFYQGVRHVRPAAVSATLRPVSDSQHPLNHGLRLIGVGRRMAWYKVSDLTAELRAWPACLANALDVVHYMDGEHTGQYLQRWIRRSRWSRVKTVATFHQPPELLSTLVNPCAIRDLDLVLVVSPTQESFFRQFLPASRVRTMLHGVDAAFFQPPSRPRLTDGVFRCLTVGHWMRDWGTIRAVAGILQACHDIEFHVVTAQQTGLDGCPNVTTHRNVTGESLLRLYQDADVLLLPLINATANNSLLEGMACGLPVVSTRLKAVSVYVGEGAATLIEANDPAQFAHAIAALRDDRASRRQMGRAARARAEELAWPLVARQLERTYTELAEGVP